MNYTEALTEAMAWLGQQPDTLFIGQTVAAGGAGISKTLSGVPKDRLYELPVCEEMQMGMSLGLALEGYAVVSIYPRIDFLLLATNQLVNHLDKVKVMSDGKMTPRIIIRTSIGPKAPLDGGPQHTQDHAEAFRRLLTTVNMKMIDAHDSNNAMEWYRAAYERGGIWLFIEYGEHYV